MCESKHKNLSKSPYDWQPCEGCYLNHIIVFNTNTGKAFKPVCKSYTCVKHGWKQKVRLQKAMEKYFSNFSHVRMWTATISNSGYPDIQAHAKTLSEVWRYFITYLRRDKLLLENEKKVQYVRIAEPHKSGYLHYHILVDKYIHWYKLNYLWKKACKAVTGNSKASINVKGMFNGSKKAARYVSKYVVKSANAKKELNLKSLKLWTRSGNAKIFDDKPSAGTFASYHIKTGKWYGLYFDWKFSSSKEDENTFTCNNIEQHHSKILKSSQESLIFSTKPPD